MPEILSYAEMCRREGLRMQRGMHFRLGEEHSVLLTTLRANTPYHDEQQGFGAQIIYQGHDVFRSKAHPDPEAVDQPEYTSGRRLTQNGLFYNAALEYKHGFIAPERVRVYQKILPGIWSYNGVFLLVDGWKERGERLVFKFKLQAETAATCYPPANETLQTEAPGSDQVHESPARSRTIPTRVKLAVWKRDQGRCALCGAEDDLHFDHIIPYTLGGSSTKPENIQLLCARHNLQKHARIL